MALEAEKMAVAIESAMVAYGFKPLAENGASHKWWLALAEGIISNLKEDAEVPVAAGSSNGVYKVE